jgi:Sulfotransferase family
MSNFIPTKSMTVVRKYDESYFAGEPEWIPGRAEMDITFSEDAAAPGKLRELIIELRSGPPAMYRYFPFSVYVYADERAAAVLEFSQPHETQRVVVEVPSDRFCLTFVSELSLPQQPGSSEQRELALVLSELRAGELLTPAGRRKTVFTPSKDHLSHQRVALVDEIPQPVFIVGPYRSGTSILTWAIGQHPNIWPLPETHFLPWLGAGAVAGNWVGTQPRRNYFNICDIAADEYLAYWGSCIDDFVKKTTLRRVERSQFERLHPRNSNANDEGFEFARTLFSSKRRWADGTPENAGHMALMRRLFPAAKFICTVRDPVDVITSMVHFDQAGGQSAPIEEAAEMWRRQTECTVLAGRAFGSDAVQFVSYEELIASPAETLTWIFDFLGEPRFSKAADVYSSRINSSSVSAEDRDRLRPKIAKYLAKTKIPRLYEEALHLVGATWDPDPSAGVQIDERYNSFVLRAIKGALPHLQINAPSQPSSFRKDAVRRDE